MRGQPYDVALDRARRLVNERRFALGVQLIDRRRDPLEVAEGYARVAEGALVALGEAAVAEFEQAHGRFPGGELVVLGARPARRLRADPRLRPRPHLPAHRAAGRRVGRRASRSAPTIISTGWRAASPPRSACPTAAGPLYEVDTRLRPEGAKGMLDRLARRVRAISARGSLDVGAYGAVPRPAGVRLARRCASAPAAIDRRHPAHAARSGEGRRGRGRRCARDMERHKPPQSALDVKLGPGGLVDLEFAVHVLQLTTACRPRPAARSRARGSLRPRSWFRQILSMRKSCFRECW